MGNVELIHYCKHSDDKGALSVLWEANCNAD